MTSTDYEATFDPEAAGLLGLDDRLARVLFDGWSLGQISDLASHSADAGWPGLTYTSDLVELYQAHGEDFWALARSVAEEMGSTMAELMSYSKNPDAIDSQESLATWLVWLAAETISRQICPES